MSVPPVLASVALLVFALFSIRLVVVTVFVTILLFGINISMNMSICTGDNNRNGTNGINISRNISVKVLAPVFALVSMLALPST